MEKDERFWLATALMSLYHQDGDATRSELFGQLMNRAKLQPPGSYASWADALSGRLELFFEVNLPSPPSYRQWLRDHLDERMPIPHLKARAQGAGVRLEGATKADAMLLAPGTGVAVILEAKVLSDISTHVRFDFARNQLARLIDVLLDANPRLRDPLSHREPARTCLVLLTPALLHPGTARNAAASRLYGWLMPAYQDPDSSLLHQHLPHRERHDLAEITTRLGWASWEDCATILPGACPWLTTTHSRT